MKLSPQQSAALAKAQAVVSLARAREIVRLKRWEHGACLCLNAEKPAVTPLTAAENQAIHELWESLPGWTSWMTALSLLAGE